MNGIRNYVWHGRPKSNIVVISMNKKEKNIYSIAIKHTVGEMFNGGPLFIHKANLFKLIL